MPRPAALLAALLAAGAPPAAAHDVDVTGVARVFLDETGDGLYRLSVVDRQAPPLFDVTRILPGRCEGLPPSSYSYRFRCAPALDMEDALRFPWALEGVVVIARWRDGGEVSGYFPGDGAFVEAPLADLKAGARSMPRLAGRYLVLGVEHILFGVDHLLFVLGLLLLMRGFWPLVKTVTAFTAAHSLTLALAALGSVPAPGAPIELLIALSIVLLAREALAGRRGGRTLARERPWIVALVFGLFHGFGFAGALGELGLRDADIAPALLFFNLGVEAGQLAFIGAAAAVHRLARRWPADLTASARRGLAYGLGGTAAFWCLERAPALLAAA